MSVTASSQNRFNADAALRTARGFHHAAGLLEAMHQQNIAQLPKGVDLGADIISQAVGMAAGAVVLEALAVELLLKVRLHRAGQPLKKTHKHADLFALLPEPERNGAEQRYAAWRLSAMRGTLEEVLKFSSDLFEKWRYMHEHGTVEVSMGELQRAFGALQDGL
jgi:hypothetical protein